MTFKQHTAYPTLTPVRVVTTSNQAGVYVNGPLNNGVGSTFVYTATGATIIDDVTLVAGDSILFIGQTAAKQNGIYIVNVAGGTGVSTVLQRRGDMQCIEQLLLGQYVSVSAGTVNGGTLYALIEPAPNRFGIDDLVFGNNLANLGTAATQNATNSSLGKVASVNAPIGVTIGDMIIFDDNAGTIKSAGFSMVFGTSTQWAGTGTSSHDYPCPGVTSFMSILVSAAQNGSTATILQAACTSPNTITVQYSATPGSAQNISYIGLLTG